MIVEPYLCFEGRCEEALDFYREKLGANVVAVLRFKDNPDAEGCGGGEFKPDPEKIMHACFKIGESTIMASDGRCAGGAKFEGISLTISVKEKAEAERLFAAVSDGGEVSMPMTETFFSPAFGMATDRFGVSWMVLVGQEDCMAK